MRVFATKPFQKFARQNDISDGVLCKAMHELEQGLIHARLGGGVYKQRIARKGQGKSGSFRTIVFFRAHEMTFFFMGFAKNVQDNLHSDELAGLKDIAGRMLKYDDKTISLALQDGAIKEIFCA